MNSAWRDARGALGWGFWFGLAVAMVVLTLDAILAGGFGAGAFAHLYLHGLEKKAQMRRR